MKNVYIIVSEGKARPVPEGKAGITHTLEVANTVSSNDCGTSSYFVVEDGVPRVKNKAELKVRDDKVAKDTAKAELKQTRL